MVEVPSDGDLVDSVLRGRRDDYGVLIARHGDRVMHLLLRMTRSESEAQELAQETFVKAYFALESFDTTRSFRAWVCRIATNICINSLRRRKWQSDMGEDDEAVERSWSLIRDPGDDPEDAFLRQETCEALHRHLAALPDDHREILTLRFLAELSYQEICDTTHLPMGTVKSRIARARLALNDLMHAE